MKYLLLIALLAFSFPAEARKHATVTLDANETLPIAQITRGGWWMATVKSTGDFGGGTLTLVHSSAVNCTTNPATEKDITGATYSATDDDIVNVEHGVASDGVSYLCAKMTGATSPDVDLVVEDNR